MLIPNADHILDGKDDVRYEVDSKGNEKRAAWRDREWLRLSMYNGLLKIPYVIDNSCKCHHYKYFAPY